MSCLPPSSAVLNQEREQSCPHAASEAVRTEDRAVESPQSEAAIANPRVPIDSRPPSLRKPVIGTLSTNLSVFALGLGTSVLLNRSLGPQGKGVYATLLTTAQLILMVCSLGLGKSVTFYLANREEKAQSVFNVFLGMMFLTAVVGLLLLLPISSFSGRGEIYQGPALHSMAALIVLWLLHASALGVLRGLKEFGACNFQSLLTTAIFTACALLMIIGGNLSPAVAVWCKTFSFTAGLLWIWPKLRAFGFRFRPKLELALATKMLSYGLGFFLYALFQNLSYRFDLILVAHMTGLSAAGWYSTASGLAEIIWYFPNAIGTVLFPVIAGLGDYQRDKLVCKTCRWSILIMALGVAALVLLAPVVVPLLYGKAFFPTVGAIYSLSFGILTNGMFQILGVHLAAKKRLGILTIITATGFAANLLLNLILIPRFGIVGAGLSSTISYSISGFLTAWVFSRTTGATWREMFLISSTEFQEQARCIVKRLNLLKA